MRRQAKPFDDILLDEKCDPTRKEFFFYEKIKGGSGGVRKQREGWKLIRFSC